MPPPPHHPSPASRPQPRPPLAGGARGPKWAQMDPKWPKVHFFHFWGPKCKKVLISTFGAQSAEKCSFAHFDPKKSKFRCRNHLFHKHLRPGGKKDPKCISGPKNAFWGPKCISGPKMHFGPPNAFLGPKMHFGVLFTPWPHMLMKQMVSASNFRLFGAKMRK